MTFTDIMEIILDIEGGDEIVDDRDDPGGLTKWGISLNNNPELNRQQLMDLDKAGALRIYKKKYWSAGKVSSFPAALRLAMMDGVVNAGAFGNAQLVQEAANRLGARLVVDGIIGPRTLAAIKSFDRRLFMQQYLAARLRHYRRLPTYSKFGSGWEDRLFRIALETNV